ncbi:hypothetical protein JTB14_028373 [Gonioctena quinquepunctata]|nr:hypothetical protein JTB14_028373 [Gonioctena quinquepunctata]
MDGEDAINKSDFFLKEIPDVKISRDNNQFKKTIVKEELQFLTITESMQDKILETLKYIHGPEFKLNDVSSYEETKSNMLKKYWVGQGTLVVKGGFDFSNSKDEPTEEIDRLRQFALMRLESYGFHKNHCLEAFNYCKGDVEDSIYLLYHKYFNWDGSLKEIDHGLTEKELLEQRNDEKSSLDSIYENSFKAKTDKVVVNMDTNVDFHEIEKVEVTPNAHLENYSFDLEFRFPLNTKYPYEPPLVFLKTNAVLPPLLNLHICKKLYEEAKLLAEDGIPCVYAVTELLQNEDVIKQHLKQEIDFIHPNQKLFEEREVKAKGIKPSHYKKGITNR